MVAGQNGPWRPMAWGVKIGGLMREVGTRAEEKMRGGDYWRWGVAWVVMALWLPLLSLGCEERLGIDDGSFSCTGDAQCGAGWVCGVGGVCELAADVAPPEETSDGPLDAGDVGDETAPEDVPESDAVTDVEVDTGCVEGEAWCEGACIEVLWDDDNCGDCGVVCTEEMSCVLGRCLCPGGLENCGDVCVDTRDEVAHCGACDSPCGAGESCGGGRCLPFACPLGFVRVGAGDFVMGSEENEPGRDVDEAAFAVRLTRDYCIQAKEVSQVEFLSAMGFNPSAHASCGSSCPVETVNWHEAAAYANVRSVSEGLPACYTCEAVAGRLTCEVALNPYTCLGYRLPTEAEWEYAARAGTVTAFHAGDLLHLGCSPVDPVLNGVGWYCGNSAGPQPGGGKAANPWGLYDMSGNVFEWVNDWYAPYPGIMVVDPAGPGTGEYRMRRGGSWAHESEYSRHAARIGDEPTVRAGFLGFRMARLVPF